MIEVPRIRYVSRIAINTAFCAPSAVILKIHSCTIGSPGVRNRLNNAVISIKTMIAFNPFTMNLNGTFDVLITANRNAVAASSAAIPLKQNSDII